MDPNECLMRWARAVLSEDRSEANDAYEDLRSWMERGGFEPSWGERNTRGVTLPSRKQFFSYNPLTGRME